MLSSVTCKNCGSKLQENYCAKCGEKRFDKKQLAVKHFVEETFEGLVHFDNKLFRTIKTLFIKPGQLSLDYVEGRRAGYMKPIQLFVVINLLFFFLMAVNPYRLYLYNYITFSPFTKFNTAAIVHDKVAHLGITQATYSYIFNERMRSESKELIFVFIPLYAAMCWLFFAWYKRLIVEHLVFATHFVVFVLCWFFLQIYIIGLPLFLIPKIRDAIDFDTFISIVSSVVVGVYFSIASRRFYKAGIVLSLLTGLLIGITFLGLIQAYRILLFFKIIYL